MEIVIQILVLLLIWMLGNFMISRLFKFFLRKKAGLHVSFLSSVTQMVWVVIMFSLVLDTFVETKTIGKTLLTSSGLLVAATGFAAQQVLADVISGIMISWSKPFDVGEKISISDLNISGIIESISLRHTVVKTYQNSRLIVPNSIINKSVIENSNYDNHYIGHFLEIPISYESDLDKAIQIMESVIASHPLVIDPRPDPEVGQKVQVYVNDLGENGAVLKCTVCTETIDDNFTACSEIRKDVKRQFDFAGIKIHEKRVKIMEPKGKEISQPVRIVL